MQVIELYKTVKVLLIKCADMCNELIIVIIAILIPTTVNKTVNDLYDQI